MCAKYTTIPIESTEKMSPLEETSLRLKEETLLPKMGTNSGRSQNCDLLEEVSNAICPEVKTSGLFYARKPVKTPWTCKR